MRTTRLYALFVSIGLLLFAACSAPAPGTTPVVSFKDSSKSLRIVGSPPFTVLDPIIADFNKKNGTQVQLQTLPDMEILLQLREKERHFDVVAPSTEQWLTMANAGLVVGQTESMFKSPVVLAVRKPKADELKLSSRSDVTVREFQNHVVAKKLKFAMPNPSVSGVGSAAHLGFIDALKDRSGPTTSADLQNPVLRTKLQELYSGVGRSSADSKTLKDQILASPDEFDAFVNFEAYVLQINRELVRKNLVPYTLVYLVDGMAVAEFPFGPMNGLGPEKQKIFEDFKRHLATPEVKKQIHDEGWRTSLFGLSLGDNPPEIYNASWGVQKSPVGSLQYPNVQIFEQARNLYQTLFRLGSFTIYLTDHSSSMDLKHITDPKTKQDIRRIDAMRVALDSLLDPDLANSFGLAPTPNDITMVVPFCGDVHPSWSANPNAFTVRGADKLLLTEVAKRMKALNYCDSTGIYTAVNAAVELFKKSSDVQNLSPAIVLMTDGENNKGISEKELITNYNNAKIKVPVYAILFGEAKVSNITETIRVTSGAYWDAKTVDLGTIIRRVKAQN